MSLPTQRSWNPTPLQVEQLLAAAMLADPRITWTHRFHNHFDPPAVILEGTYEVKAHCAQRHYACHGKHFVTPWSVSLMPDWEVPGKWDISTSSLGVQVGQGDEGYLAMNVYGDACELSFKEAMTEIQQCLRSLREGIPVDHDQCFAPGSLKRGV